MSVRIANEISFRLRRNGKDEVKTKKRVILNPHLTVVTIIEFLSWWGEESLCFKHFSF
jgi:hypothetical protein